MKLSEACENYLTYLVAEKGDSKSTLKSYKVDLKNFLDFCSNINVCDLTLNDVNNFILFLSEKKVSRKTLIRKATVIRGLYKYLYSEDIIKINLDDIEIPKNDSRLPTFLTLEEVQRLLKAIISANDFTFYVIFAIIISCGLRVSELTNLKMDNLNMIDGYIKISGKGNKERILPLNVEVLNHIKKLLSVRKSKKGNRYLFINKKGKKISRQYIYKKIKYYAKSASIQKNISPHTLRHTYATLLLNNGAQLKEVQLLLGHAQIQTTEIYTHLANEKIKNKYDELMKR